MAKTNYQLGKTMKHIKLFEYFTAKGKYFNLLFEADIKITPAKEAEAIAKIKKDMIATWDFYFSDVIPAGSNYHESELEDFIENSRKIKIIQEEGKKHGINVKFLLTGLKKDITDNVPKMVWASVRWGKTTEYSLNYIKTAIKALFIREIPKVNYLKRKALKLAMIVKYGDKVGFINSLTDKKLKDSGYAAKEGYLYNGLYAFRDIILELLVDSSYGLQEPKNYFISKNEKDLSYINWHKYAWVDEYQFINNIGEGLKFDILESNARITEAFKEILGIIWDYI